MTIAAQIAEQDSQQQTARQERPVQEPWVESLLSALPELEKCVQHYLYVGNMSPAQLAAHLFLHVPADDGASTASIYRLPPMSDTALQQLAASVHREMRRRVAKLLLDLVELQQFVNPDAGQEDGGPR